MTMTPISSSATPPASPSEVDSRFISLREVSYFYDPASAAPPALDNISLDIAAGEFVALLGHNGSGKSTLAAHINGLRQPTRGQVLVSGLDTRDRVSLASIRELVGMIFADPDNQIIATVVEDDVAWSLAARGYPRDEIARRVDAALNAVSLADERKRPPTELSGGQRQRLAVASALALRPVCLVADEPTSLLDPQARRETLALLGALRREYGLTLVYVTHLLEEAALADRIVVLEYGRIALEGPPAMVLSDLDRLHALRLVVPEIALLGARLREYGVPVPYDAVSPEALLDALDAFWRGARKETAP
jgi:energy-coupling factor transport system ATP-binding protein